MRSTKNTEGKIEKERKSLDNQHQDSLITSSREYRRRQIAFNKGTREIQAMLSNKKKSTLHSTFQSIGMRAIFFQHEISTFPLRLTFEKFFFSDSANGRSVSLCFNIESCCSQKKLACWRSECELIFFLCLSPAIKLNAIWARDSP